MLSGPTVVAAMTAPPAAAIAKPAAPSMLRRFMVPPSEVAPDSACVRREIPTNLTTRRYVNTPGAILLPEPLCPCLKRNIRQGRRAGAGEWLVAGGMVGMDDRDLGL